MHRLYIIKNSVIQKKKNYACGCLPSHLVEPRVGAKKRPVRHLFRSLLMYIINPLPFSFTFCSMMYLSMLNFAAFQITFFLFDLTSERPI